jgi:hypothetical protein
MLEIQETTGGYIARGIARNWAAFRAGVIFSAAAAAPKPDGLPAFTGLQIERAGDVLGIAATDRYRMAYAPLDGSPVDDFKAARVDVLQLIPAKELLKAIKPARVGSFALSVDVAAGVWSLTVDDTMTQGRSILADFPKWRQVIPLNDTSGQELHGDGFNLNPALLSGIMAGISKAYGDLYKGENKGVNMSQRGKNKPVILSGFSDSAAALIMPIRTV